MKILFTSIGRRVELIQMFLRASEKEQIPLEIHGADLSETAPALYFCQKKHIVPRITDERYLPELYQICEKEQIDLLIPTIDTDLILLSENKAHFESIGTKVLISDAEFVKCCRNKMLTEKLFRNAGLHAPASFDDISRYSAGFPAFIKPVGGSASVNAYRVDDERKLEILAEEIEHYIVQPFVSGDEYTVDVFCDFCGNPVFITPRRRLSMRSGEVIKTQIDQDRKIIEEVKRLVEAIRPCGSITVQLVREKNTGIDWFIEINPRFGGGAPLTMDAGADSAAAILRLLDGKSVSYCENAAEDGALYLRFDQSIKLSKNEYGQNLI